MTFGMFYKTTPVFLSKKTGDSPVDDASDDMKSSGSGEDGTGKKRNSAPLPRIRVEECGLTVDTRRKKGGEGDRHYKDAADQGSPKGSSKAGSKRTRDKGLAGESTSVRRREGWLKDARDAVTNGQDSGTMESSISTEFVDSLRIGKADGRALTRGQALPGPLDPRPVPRIRYTTRGTDPAGGSCSIGEAVDTFQKKRAASIGAVSSRERVVIRRLAARRSEATAISDSPPVTTDRIIRRFGSDRLQPRASWRERRCHSLEDSRSGRLGMVSRKYKRGGSSHGDEYDFSLTFVNQDDLVRDLRSRSGIGPLGVPASGPDESRLGRPGDGDGLNGASDGPSLSHSVDCPLCHLYEPSRFGHVCPPNTPLGQHTICDEAV